jgi:hypothetical protein
MITEQHLLPDDSVQQAAVIIASKAGRLGNRLFLSAYFMANALARGYRLINPALGEYAPFFEGSARDPLSRFPVTGVRMDPEVAAQCREILEPLSGLAGVLVPGGRTLDIRQTLDAADGVYDLNNPEFSLLLKEARFLAVKGWKFRDNANLVRYHGVIARYFQPIASIRKSAEALLRDARALGDLVIGVHIRQGDYRDWKSGIHYFETQQYAHWMREGSLLFPGKRVVFLVCASDPVEASCFRGLEVVMGPGSVIGDLDALSLCDLIMGPPSTFSTWASYAGRVPLCMLQQHHQVVTRGAFTLHDRV